MYWTQPISSYATKVAASVVTVAMAVLPANATAQHSLGPTNPSQLGLLQSRIEAPAATEATQTAYRKTIPVASHSTSSVPANFSRNGLQAKGTWALTAEMVFADIDDSNALIGSPAAPQAIGPYSSVNLGNINGGTVGSAALNPSLIGEDTDDGSGLGWRAALEYRNPDDGGFQLEGMMVSDLGGSWQRGVGGFGAGANPATVRVGAALPLDVPGGTPFTIPYDQFFKVKLETSVDSISAMFAPAGFYSGAIRFQPTLGFRYLRVDQDLDFAGAGSGLTWTPRADGTPDPAAAPTFNTAPYQTTVNSSAETNLYGPVIGLNATTTRQIIRLNGIFRAGVLFADEQITVGGRGVGVPGTPGFNPLTPFASSRSGSNATFMFESQLAVDVQIFQLLNKLNGRNFGSSLVLRVGWSLLWLDELAKADESIRWNGFPSTPTARRRSSDFTMDSVNIGLILKY